MKNNFFSAAMQAATAPPKPIRKPDPDLRTLQRQISFGSVSGFPAITSLKRKPMSQGMVSKNNIYKHEKFFLPLIPREKIPNQVWPYTREFYG